MAKKPASKLRSAPTTKCASAVQPNLHQEENETQKYGEIVKSPDVLSEDVCKKSVALLNQCLADTITLRDMYKKHHRQVVGPTFNQLHLMYDHHSEGQVLVVDIQAERVQLLGGISLAMAADDAEVTRIPAPAAWTRASCCADPTLRRSTRTDHCCRAQGRQRGR